jgi:hypothetical protein
MIARGHTAAHTKLFLKLIGFSLPQPRHLQAAIRPASRARRPGGRRQAAAVRRGVGLGLANREPPSQFGPAAAHPFGPDGCGPVTAFRNRK